MTYMPKFIQPTTENDKNIHINPEAELLKKQSREKLSCLLAGNDVAAPAAIYITRLEAELKILEDKDYCGYFLIVADYVQWAKDNSIAVGPGRGSGPCSLVGFALGITNIDPIKYDLPFERFINPERDALPDFDLDFCDERRTEVTDYIKTKYGADRVAQISSDDTTPLPSRLVICDRPLEQLVSLYTMSDSNFPAAKMNIAQVADAGLVQFNAINQKALTIIQRAVQTLTQSGQPIDINSISLDDSDTYRLLSAGELSNIAVLDDEHYKNTLVRVQPDRFENLYAVIALCQPRSQGNIQHYVERKQNPHLVQYLHPALESITAETYGLVLYQEQVMHIAHKIAGFTLAQSDLFRRALKKSDRTTTNYYKNKFINGATNTGVSPAEAVQLFDYVAESNLCSSNKSHAVAFAMIAYQTAWLKSTCQAVT